MLFHDTPDVVCDFFGSTVRVNDIYALTVGTKILDDRKKRRAHTRQLLKIFIYLNVASSTINAFQALLGGKIKIDAGIGLAYLGAIDIH